jgi:hypothetical protein
LNFLNYFILFGTKMQNIFEQNAEHFETKKCRKFWNKIAEHMFKQIETCFNIVLISYLMKSEQPLGKNSETKPG